MEAIVGPTASGTRLVQPRIGSTLVDKIDRINFERTPCGPKGGGQEARNNKGLVGVAFVTPVSHQYSKEHLTA